MGENDLASRLLEDYRTAKEELSQLDDRRKLLEFHVKYLETLLRTIGGVSTGAEPTSTTTARFTGMTISDIAAVILAEEGQPLAAIEISKRAMAGGFAAENIERARSHFSAIISKDINSSKPRFWQVDRGAIGLAEWKDRAAEFAVVRPENFFRQAPTTNGGSSNPSHHSYNVGEVSDMLRLYLAKTESPFSPEDLLTWISRRFDKVRVHRLEVLDTLNKLRKMKLVEEVKPGFWKRLESQSAEAQS